MIMAPSAKASGRLSYLHVNPQRYTIKHANTFTHISKPTQTLLMVIQTFRNAEFPEQYCSVPRKRLAKAFMKKRSKCTSKEQNKKKQ